MKNTWLRILTIAVVVALGAGAIASIIGWLLGWNSPRQFSDGLFWAGAILMGIGLLSMLGGYAMRTSFGIQYAETAGDMSLAERMRRWAADVAPEYRALFFLLLSGGALVGVSILLDSLADSTP